MNALNGLRNAALILTIAAGTSLTGCNQGRVEGSGEIQAGDLRISFKFSGEWGTPQGPLNYVGHTRYKGESYQVFKDASGEIFVYVPGDGYLHIDKLVELNPKPVGVGSGSSSESVQEPLSGSSILQAKRGTPGPTIDGVEFSYDRVARTASLDFPAFAGLALPINQAELRVQVMVYTSGGEERVRVTGFDHGVLIYAANCGLTKLSVPAAAQHGRLEIKTERTTLAVRDGRLTLGAIEIATTSIDDLSTPGVDEVVFLTKD